MSRIVYCQVQNLLTRDGNRSMAFVPQKRIGQPAAVGAVRFEDHCQDASDGEKTLLVGYRWDGDVLCQVLPAAVLPKYQSLGVSTIRQAGQCYDVTWLGAGVGFPGHWGFGIGGWREIKMNYEQLQTQNNAQNRKIQYLNMAWDCSTGFSLPMLTLFNQCYIQMNVVAMKLYLSWWSH